LHAEGIIRDNPTVNISLVKDDEHEGVPGLSDDQVDAILDYYDDKQFTQRRDKTLVLLLLDTGLLINKALTLNVEQVDFKELTIHVPSQIAKNRSTGKFQLVAKSVSV
jgi:integrase/recombinase XerD